MDNHFFERPILNSPYEYPMQHWELDPQGQPTQRVIESRRRAEFITSIPKAKKRKTKQVALVFDEGKGLSTEEQQYQATSSNINELRQYVDQWRRLPIFFYAFDVPILAGRDLMHEPLEARRTLLRTEVLSRLADPIRYSPVLDASLPDLIHSIRAQGLEGLIAKRRDSRYEVGQRSGAWRKMRINRGQEFVIGGYTPTPKNFDALTFGYYEGNKLIYVARTRNGFTPSSREQLFQQLRRLETRHCPFANLPEERGGGWGQGLTGREDEGLPLAEARAGRAI